MLEENNAELEQKLPKSKRKLAWYFAPVFMVFWLVLFCAVVLPLFFNLPTGLSISNEQSRSSEFIAERAQRILLDLDRIGPKIVGSWANENQTVQLLLNEIEKTRQNMQAELFELEVDVQRVTGAYTLAGAVNAYQGVQNVVVKFSAKNASSDSYLLINSHFDSAPTSPGAGDDGAMVVIMLEVLRVLATNRQLLRHPIIFLFNGAEETGLQASHGFITQHKWAKNCKVVMNFDSAGSGNREILFQTGPNHPWLVKYYSKHVKHPFANSLFEELFQTGFIPSDTDFRIFRDFGHMTGLDMAHIYNGYVYHTAFDKFDIIQKSSLQNTGDNLLALTRAFANAAELEDPSQHTGEQLVFYDYMNLFFIYYSQTEAIIINTIVAVATIILICISIWRMSVVAAISLKLLLLSFCLLFLLQLFGFALAIVLPLGMAMLFDNVALSMTWFTNKWLVFGLYVCPCLFGLAAPTLIYLSFQNEQRTRKKHKLSSSSKHNLSDAYRLHMVLHAHGIIMSIMLLYFTFMGVRSSYLFMIPLIFYACSLLFNLITKLHDKGYCWTLLHTLAQVMPFLFHTYLFHILNIFSIPIMGRFGVGVNSDSYIAVINILGSILAMGFLIHLLSAFRHSKLALLTLVFITFIFSMLTLTELGFPYRAKTNVERIYLMHMQRVYYEHNGTVSRNDSGILFNVMDRRALQPFESSVNLTGVQRIEDCAGYGFGQCRWLPTQQPIDVNSNHSLQLLNKTINNITMTARFDFELTLSNYMSINIWPFDNVTLTDWSFPKDLLQREKKPMTYYISHRYGSDNTPLRFYLQVKHSTGNLEAPLLRLGLRVEYISDEHKRAAVEKEFLSTFPNFVHFTEWPSSFERFIF